MKRMQTFLIGWLSGALAQAEVRFRRSRRGSVLVLVVAVLTLLALMGTAYLSTTRLDRAGVQQLNKDADLQQSADALADAEKERAKGWIINDLANLVTGLIVDPNDPSHQTGMFLADRAPQLLPVPAAKPTPAWRRLTQYPSFTTTGGVSTYTVQKLESPYNPTGKGIGTTTLQYDFTDEKRWAVPSHLVISYPTGGTSPVAGQTWTFPAIYLVDPNAASGNPDSYTSPTGPFLAADATGWGIADAPLRRVPVTVGDVAFYAGIRVIDNASGINVNTAWSPVFDRESASNATFNFFPPAVDLAGLLFQTGTGGLPPEMATLNAFRMVGLPAANPPVAPGTGADDAGARNDVKYLSWAESLWTQLGTRPNYPNRTALAGDPKTSYGRPFNDDDTGGLYLRGLLLPTESSLSKLDRKMADALKANPMFKDSIYQGAANYFTSPQNKFMTYAATDVLAWYDWNWNFDGISLQQRTATYDILGQLGTNYGGHPFRTPRGLLVASNPVSNQCFFVDYRQLPPEVKGSGIAGSSPETMADPNVKMFPHKTGLNTAEFPELWRAFVNVLADDAPPGKQFGKPPALWVPGDTAAPGGGNNTNTAQFRNPIRMPGSGGSSESKNGNAPNNAATLGFDSRSTLLLRAALAAVNAETLRNNDGTPGSSAFQPNVLRRHIKLKMTNGTDADVLVYGVGMQPYIGAVLADTDNSDHSGKSNPSGLVAIKLVNPYPVALDLTGYGAIIVNRTITPPPGGMAVTPLTFATTNLTIAPNDYLVLTNYDPSGAGAGATPPAQYWDVMAYGPAPSGSHLATMADLGKVLDVATNGEVVLLRPITAGTTGSPEAPVDAFDFSGLTMKAPPGGGPTTQADMWYYTRDVEVTPGTPTDKRWRFVCPGIYDQTAAVGKPRLINGSVDEKTWDPVATAGVHPYVTTPPATPLDFTKSDSTMLAPIVNPFGPMQLCNVDFGGFNKPGSGAPGARQFPYGGFARVGDVLQVTFMGSYTVLEPGGSLPGPNAPWNAFAPGGAGTTQAVIEMNPVTMDSMYVDDGDSNDDKLEHVGRFIPLRDTTNPPAFDDYSSYGHYRGMTTSIPNPPAWVNLPLWHYRFANKVLQQFTTVTNPADDYFPNFERKSYKGTVPPTVIPQSKAAAAAQFLIATTRPSSTISDEGQEDKVPVEGLINVNTAPWRVLAAVELCPYSQDPTGAINQAIAKGIVYFRDVDDGETHADGKKHGHGPFSSIAELNMVWDTQNGVAGNTFANAWGKLPATYPDVSYGNFIPGPANQAAINASYPLKDWLIDNLMVNRASNLLTVRSDSFTVYVVVQGWRNANTNAPELVVQKRVAATIDRSGMPSYIPPTKGPSPVVHQLPTK